MKKGLNIATPRVLCVLDKEPREVQNSRVRSVARPRQEALLELDLSNLEPRKLQEYKKVVSSYLQATDRT